MATETQTGGSPDTDLLRLAADILTAYLSRNALPLSAVPGAITEVYRVLAGLGDPGPDPAPTRRRPAVPIARSVQHDHIVCLEDGKQLKMLKRYLRSRFDMSPDDYRRKWGLPPDYPMVAPAYAERRSVFAKKIGLGKGVRRARST